MSLINTLVDNPLLLVGAPVDQLERGLQALVLSGRLDRAALLRRVEAVEAMSTLQVALPEVEPLLLAREEQVRESAALQRRFTTAQTRLAAAERQLTRLARLEPA